MKKILYIEDEADQIEMVRARLESNGYACSAARDGEEGLAKARAEKPDLILLDFFLPKVSGLEVCRRLRTDLATKAVPVIMITASGVEYVEDQCKEAGADDCLLKPYEGSVLVKKVKALLKE